MSRYQLSPQATKSLLQISEYTLVNFGQKQKTIKLKMLRERMRTAAKKPEKGKDRSEIKAGYYSVQAQSHHIYYRIRGTQIEIIDVLHQSMEPTRHIA